MNNNEILHSIRYAFKYTDAQMMGIFLQAEQPVTEATLGSWLKKDSDESFLPLSDPILAMFLNGWINKMRGKKEGEQPIPERTLTNNIIFRKIKIALNLQADGILEIMALADSNISKHELSAFFRKVDHKHYRECKDQVLRKFIKGMQLQHRNSVSLSA